MTKISVVIIARDNEVEIARCLNSVKGADEIIVLDTGSIDQTPQIAIKHRARVYYARWNDDFAEARNKALDYTANPWILMLDTDEELQGGIEKVRQFVTQEFTRKAIATPIIDPEKEFYGLRLFRKSGAYYVGKIHEELNVRPDYYTDEIWIKHTPSKNHKTDPDRNIRILRQVLEENPLSTRDMYFLGNELYSQGKYDSALYWLEYYQQCTPRTQNWTCEAFYLIAECYSKLHRANKAVEALMRAVEVNPEFKLGYQRLQKLTRNAKWGVLAEQATNKNILVYRMGKNGD